MRAQESKPNDLTGNGLDKIVHEHDIAERFGHLFVVHRQEAVMYPVTRKVSSVMCAAALRQFVLMMRKHEILPSGVDIDRIAEVSCSHRGTFDMPAGPSPAPWRIPSWQLRCGRLP